MSCWVENWTSRCVFGDLARRLRPGYLNPFRAIWQSHLQHSCICDSTCDFHVHLVSFAFVHVDSSRILARHLESVGRLLFLINIQVADIWADAYVTEARSSTNYSTESEPLLLPYHFMPFLINMSYRINHLGYLLIRGRLIRPCQYCKPQFVY